MSRIGFIVLAVCALAAFGLHKRQATAAGGPVSADQRAATLRFAPGVTPQDRAWILAAVGSARPEARRLIDEIDGLVEMRTDLRHDQAIGMAEMHGDSATISLDASAAERRAGRRPRRRRAPRAGPRHRLRAPRRRGQAADGRARSRGSAPPSVEERFAETFAKWALNGRVSIAGDGYGIPNPPSIEDWGAPLARLAIELDLER